MRGGAFVVLCKDSGKLYKVALAEDKALGSKATGKRPARGEPQ